MYYKYNKTVKVFLLILFLLGIIVSLILTPYIGALILILTFFCCLAFGWVLASYVEKGPIFPWNLYYD